MSGDIQKTALDNVARRSDDSRSFREAPQSLPHDIALEKAILGAMLLEDDSRHLAFEKLSLPEIFYYPSHQKIFQAISLLYKTGAKNADVISVISSLKADGILDNVGGEAYLYELQNNIPTTANLEKWCEILSGLYSLRRMIVTCKTAIEKCYDAGANETQDIFSSIESDIFKIRDINSKMRASMISDHIVDAVKYLEKLHRRHADATGISTGMSNIDEIIIGLRNQEMIVIAARPSIGKTSLALNIASNIAVNKGRRVAFFSLEMSVEQLTRRMLCSLAEVSERDFYDKNFSEEESGMKWSRITKAASELKKAQFLIDPSPALSIGELKAKALRLKAKYDIDLLIIDYLQLMRAEVSRNDNRQVEVSAISVGIKSLAKELNIPVLVLAQLNRQAEQQERPRLSHLRESGAIEQDADIVMFLHRERDPQKDNTAESLEAELIVEKNRNGQTGAAKLLFFPKIMTFRSLSRYANEE